MNLIKSIITLVGLVVIAVYGVKLYQHSKGGAAPESEHLTAVCQKAVDTSQVLRDSFLQEIGTAMETAKDRRAAEEPAAPGHTESGDPAGPASAAGQSEAVQSGQTVGTRVRSDQTGPIDFEDEQITAKILNEAVDVSGREEPMSSEPITPEELDAISRIYQEANEALR